MTNMYNAADYANDDYTQAMMRRGIGGAPTLDAAALYTAMYEAEKAGDIGNVYLVDPDAGTVQYTNAEALTRDGVTLDYADVYTSADVREGIRDAMPGNELPGYYHVFDRAETLEPRNYRFHLQNFVEGDAHEEPRAFYFQSIAIECMRSEGDEFYDVEPIGDAYGWALLATAVTK